MKWKHYFFSGLRASLPVFPQTNRRGIYGRIGIISVEFFI